MTRLIGILLGVSFQTELLIMTLLGLANSTLDWKPFELIPRLNLIKELNFSDDNVEFSNSFSDRIRKLLTITVVVEFFCGLLNPLTYLLKLYPIITWSRSNLLLPWLLTHALNTLLPKMLSVSLVFVFYKANKISTLSLLEFVVVETINLSIAAYNWYVFFAFYLNLRRVEENRGLQSASEEKIVEGSGSLSQVYSSIPDLQEIFGETLIEPDQFPKIRSVRSLAISIESDSQELDEDSSLTLSSDVNLSPAERSMKILNLTLEDLEDAKKDKYCVDASNFGRSKESNSSVETYKAACSCSSSDDDDDDNDGNTAFFISKKLQTRKDPPDLRVSANESQMSIEIHSRRPRINLDPSNSLNQSTQITANFRQSSPNTIFNYPFTSLVLNRSHSNSRGFNDNLYFLLTKNIERLDKMCRTICNKSKKSAPKDNMEKWLVFQHELECNLHRHVLSKESTVDSKKNLSLTSESSSMAKHDLQRKIRNDAIEFKPEIDQVTSTNHNDSKLSSFSAFNRMLSRNTYAYQTDTSSPQSPTKLTRNSVKSRKANVSDLKSIKTRRLENMNDSKMQELQNLKIYNYFTLEQDRREKYGKNKKSRMLSYKNVAVTRKQDEHFENARCNVLNEETENLHNVSDCFEIRKLLSKYKLEKNNEKLQIDKKKTSVNKFENQEKVSRNLKAQRPRLFSAKNLPKKLNYLSQGNRANMRELIKKINWKINLSTSKQLSPMKIKQLHYVKKVNEDSERVDIFEDETLSELQSAFSHSDDNERGFHLGPETNQPYPIFQIVAMTLTEILKVNGCRSSTELFDTEIDFPMSDDVIFCGNEIECATPNDPSTANKWDEIERRKAESASLVRQLEELLDTSRETLSAIETSRSINVDPHNVLQHYYERLQSDDIAQTIANWATESIDSMDSIEFAANLKFTDAAAASFSDNSEMEEFPAI